MCDSKKIVVVVDNPKWSCPHCLKSYSKNYKYKIHLNKCLIYQQNCKTIQNVMVELKQELKTEMLDMFKEMIISLKDELRQQALTDLRKGVI